MARLANLNTYKAVFPDSQERSIAAENMTDAIQTLADLHNGEPSLLQKTFTGMVISVPDPTISVKTEVTGTGAPVGTLISQYKKVAMSGYLYCDGSTFYSSYVVNNC